MGGLMKERLKVDVDHMEGMMVKHYQFSFTDSYI